MIEKAGYSKTFSRSVNGGVIMGLTDNYTAYNNDQACRPVGGDIVKDWDKEVIFHRSRVVVEQVCDASFSDCTFQEKITPGTWKVAYYSVIYRIVLNLVTEMIDNCGNTQITGLQKSSYFKYRRPLGMVQCSEYANWPTPGAPTDILWPPAVGFNPLPDPPSQGSVVDTGTTKVNTVRVLVPTSQVAYDQRNSVLQYKDYNAQCVIILPFGVPADLSKLFGPAGPHCSGTLCYVSYYNKVGLAQAVYEQYRQFVEYLR